MKERLNAVITLLLKSNPSPKTELYFTNNYTMLVAVMLSAQATDKSVNLVTKDKLFAKVSTPQEMLDFGEKSLSETIKTINYYKTKARHIIETSLMLRDNFNNEVPNTMEALTSLNGVGRKTANVILSTAFGLEGIAVDTHVGRVAFRLGLTKNTKPDKIEKDLINLSSKIKLNTANLHNAIHHLFVLHGRYVCKSKKPECYQCVLSEHCRHYNNTIS